MDGLSMPSGQLSVCPTCGSTNLRIESAQVATIAQRSVAPFLDEFSVCDQCGSEFYTNEQSLASSRAFAAAARKAQNLLSPDEIRQARVRLGLTQPQFEEQLGVGKKTVVRWERGTVVPSKAANGLLWLALRYPSVFQEYARERLGRDDSKDPKIIASFRQARSGDAQRIPMRYTVRAPADELQTQATQELSERAGGNP